MTRTSTITFVDSNGDRVPGKRFINPDGTPGGYVAKNAKIARGVVVETDSVVAPGATVRSGRVLHKFDEVAEGETY